MTPNTDVILCCHSTLEHPTISYFKACVESIRKHTHNIRFIFVSDGCEKNHDEEMQSIISNYPESLYLRTPKQMWFTRSHNLGLRFARTPWVVMLNIDTVVDEGWLEELYTVRDEVENTFRDNGWSGRVGLVGSEMSDEEPRRWQNITSPSTPGNPGYCTGHGLLLNMQALYDTSADRGTPGIYLDETKQEMIHIRSDNELSHRLQKLGYLTVRSFKSRIGHWGGKSWSHNLARVGALTLDEVNFKWT